MAANSGKNRFPSTRVICFDVSETLVAWNGAFESGLKEAIGEWIGRWKNEDEAAQMLDRAMLRYRTSRKQGKKRLASIRSALDELPETGGKDRTAKLIALRARELQPLKAAFVPGAEETLRLLSSSYRLAVITNLPKAQAKQIWKRLKLNRFIKETDLISAEGRARKPDRRLFISAAVKMGVPPGRCLMIGDSYRNDIQGALRSGWQAVWIRKKARRTSVRRARDKINIVVVPSIHTVPRLFGLKG